MMNKGVECPLTAVLRVIYIRLFAYFIRFLLGAPSEICTTFICALTDNEYHCYYYYFYHQHHHHLLVLSLKRKCDRTPVLFVCFSVTRRHAFIGQCTFTTFSV